MVSLILCTTGAALLGAIDYKRTFATQYQSEEERLKAYSECHTRSARRVLRALLANGGKSSRPAACRRSTGDGLFFFSQVFSSKWGSIWLHCESSETVILNRLVISNPTIRIVLPREWTSTMVGIVYPSAHIIWLSCLQRPLQDRCEPTPYEALEELFATDMGESISEEFEDFDPNPIGVASLAQVHVGVHRESGKRVAVKVRHIFHPAFIST